MCYDFHLNHRFNPVVERILAIHAHQLAAAAATTANSSGAAQVFIGETKPGTVTRLPQHQTTDAGGFLLSQGEDDDSFVLVVAEGPNGQRIYQLPGMSPQVLQHLIGQTN